MERRLDLPHQMSDSEMNEMSDMSEVMCFDYVLKAMISQLS